MKVLPPAILLLEAVVVALSIPVALTAAGRGALAAWVLAVLALLLVLASGVVRRPRGLAIGWVLQLLVLAAGFIVPAMFALGVVFMIVWWTAVHFGARADRAAEAYRRTAPTAGSDLIEPGESEGTSAPG